MKLSMTLAIALLAFASTSQAQMSAEVKMPAASPPAAGWSAVLTEGVVQQVDAKTGVVTQKHDDITNMKMPAMTMVFGVADRKMLDVVKAGDKVRFHVEMLKGVATVTRLEPAR